MDPIYTRHSHFKGVPCVIESFNFHGSLPGMDAPINVDAVTVRLDDGRVLTVELPLGWMQWTDEHLERTMPDCLWWVSGQ